MQWKLGVCIIDAVWQYIICRFIDLNISPDLNPRRVSQDFKPFPCRNGPTLRPKAPLPNYLTADLARDIPGAAGAQDHHCCPGNTLGAKEVEEFVDEEKLDFPEHLICTLQVVMN